MCSVVYWQKIVWELVIVGELASPTVMCTV